MAANPNYAGNPRVHDRGLVSAANTLRDGSGTIVTIASGSAAGLRIQSVVVQAQVTTTAGMVRLFLSADSGTTWQLFDEIPVAAVTPSASQNAFRVERNYANLVLFSTAARLGASTHNAEAIQVWALGGDL